MFQQYYVNCKNRELVYHLPEKWLGQKQTAGKTNKHAERIFNIYCFYKWMIPLRNTDSLPWYGQWLILGILYCCAAANLYTYSTLLGNNCG